MSAEGRLAAALSKKPDLEIGDRAFDRRFLVCAQSPEVAHLAMRPELGARIMAEEFAGQIALRNGAALLNLDPPVPGAAGVAKRVTFLTDVAEILARGPRT